MKSVMLLLGLALCGTACLASEGVEHLTGVLGRMHTANGAAPPQGRRAGLRFAQDGNALAAPIAQTSPEATPPKRPSQWKQALDVTIVTTISVEALKRTFRDRRPVGEGYAFPSGHATVSFVLARVASSYHPKQKALWYLIAARIAWSRVRVRAHTWDDVIAGAALGSWIGDTAVGNGGIVLKKWEW